MSEEERIYIIAVEVKPKPAPAPKYAYAPVYSANYSESPTPKNPTIKCWRTYDNKWEHIAYVYNAYIFFTVAALVLNLIVCALFIPYNTA